MLLSVLSETGFLQLQTPTHTQRLTTVILYRRTGLRCKRPVEDLGLNRYTVSSNITLTYTIHSKSLFTKIVLQHGNTKEVKGGRPSISYVWDPLTCRGVLPPSIPSKVRHHQNFTHVLGNYVKRNFRPRIKGEQTYTGFESLNEDCVSHVFITVSH